MKIHEYQAKEILKQYKIPIQDGFVVDNKEDIESTVKKVQETFNTNDVIVKAQIHAGGRGKGGGVKLAKTLDEVRSIADDILGMYLITPQTSATGKLVNQILIAEDVYYPGESETSEFYMSVLLNRATCRNMIMYSTEGGTDIETVAEQTPHLIFTEEIVPKLGITEEQCIKISTNLGLNGVAFEEMKNFVAALYKAYDSTDSSLFEINPILKTSDNKILAVDSKVSLDNNALFRHKEFIEFPLEKLASKCKEGALIIDGRCIFDKEKIKILKSLNLAYKGVGR